MSRPKTLNSVIIAKAEEELEKIKDSKLSIQLKAIISAGENPIEKVAKIIRVSTRTVFRWIEKFKWKGIEGLKDQPKGHMESKIREEHKKQIEHWILSGRNARGEKVHWTLNKLRKEIETNFNISIGTTPLWEHLGKMDLVLKKPRPVHVKADKELQECFKKKLN